MGNSQENGSNSGLPPRTWKDRLHSAALWGGVLGLALCYIALAAFEDYQKEQRSRSDLERLFNKNANTLPDCKESFSKTFAVNGNDYAISCLPKNTLPPSP